MSEALAGAIGLGLNKIGASIAKRGEGYNALNQLALTHALNSAAAQQAHEHRLTELGVAHGFNMQHTAAQNTFTSQENALQRAHEVTQATAKHEAELKTKRQEGANARSEVRAKSKAHLNETQFAINNAAPGTKIKSGHIEFQTKLPEVVKTASKSRTVNAPRIVK